MSWNIFGEKFRIMTFGESHGRAVGVVIDGLPPGLTLDEKTIQSELDRRRPGGKTLGSTRDEADRVEILSGVFEGRTTGHPMAMIIRNEDARPEDYKAMGELFRPGHADLTWHLKYGIHDYRGGGRSSGRETAARVAAGAVARQMLDTQGVKIRAWVESVGHIQGTAFVEDFIPQNSLYCADPSQYPNMLRAIEDAKEAGDSLGGTVVIQCDHVPPGLGDPVFGKLDAMLAGALMSIGAVKAVEIGEGFHLSLLRGSQSNDPIGPDFRPITNRCGGILGGVSTGGPIRLRLGVKPTPSVAKPQKTCDRNGKETEIIVKGRHDPCICPRLVPVTEAMAALVLVDAMERQRALKGARDDLNSLRTRIDLMDREIVNLMAERMDVVSQVGRLKQELGLEIEDREREKESAFLRAQWAREEGLDENLIFELFDRLVRAGKENQSRDS